MIYGKSKKIIFYIIGTGNDYIKYMWNDVLEEENVIFIEAPIKNKFMLKTIFDKIEQKQYSYKINTRINLFGKGIWRKNYTIKDIRFDNEFKNIIIFSDVMRILTDRKFWEDLKARNSLSYCLLLLNSCEHDFNAGYDEVKRILDFINMDMIFSFDKQDVQKYNLHYFPSIYSAVDIEKHSTKYDFYFVGQKKNRFNEILNVFFTLKNLGYKCLFRITGVEQCEIMEEDGLIFNEPISYQNVINELSETSGIIDIKIPEQEGLSLRYFEAIQYNKLLLTNNKTVKDMPFYNPKYIACYNSIDEIPSLISSLDRNVQFKYDGRYSPKNFLTMIEHFGEQ